MFSPRRIIEGLLDRCHYRGHRSRGGRNGAGRGGSKREGCSHTGRLEVFDFVDPAAVASDGFFYNRGSFFHICHWV